MDKTGATGLDRARSLCGEYGVFFAAAFLAFLPHFQKGVIPWNDAAYHLSRIETLYEALCAGIFPVKVHPSFGGYGYGSGFFYPNTLLYLPAVLMLLGLSLEAAYKLFTYVLLVALTTAMYQSCKALSCDRQVSALLATGYLFSDRILYNIYDRYALGETSAAIFLPIAVSGVYLFMVKGSSPLRMIAGVTGLVHTHTITTMLTACACVILLLLSVKKIRRPKDKLLWSVLSAGVTLAVCASYLLPMWQQMRAQRLRAAAPWAVSSEYTVALTEMAAPSGIGLPVLLLTLFCCCRMLFARNKKPAMYGHAVPFLVVGVGAALLPSARGFFLLMNRLGIRLIQFPNRIYSIAIVFLLFYCGRILSHGEALPGTVPGWRHGAGRVVALVTILLALHACFIFRYIQPAQDTILQQVFGYGNDTLGAGEWLPLETDARILTTPETAVDERGAPVTGEKGSNGRYYYMQAAAESGYYVVPYIYYRGYEAVAETGEVLATGKDPDSGLLKVETPKGGLAQGTGITVQYTGTALMRISYLLSVVGLVSCVILNTAWERKHRNR